MVQIQESCHFKHAYRLGNFTAFFIFLCILLFVFLRIFYPYSCSVLSIIFLLPMLLNSASSLSWVGELQCLQQKGYLLKCSHEVPTISMANDWQQRMKVGEELIIYCCASEGLNSEHQSWTVGLFWAVSYLQPSFFSSHWLFWFFIMG